MATSLGLIGWCNVSQTRWIFQWKGVLFLRLVVWVPLSLLVSGLVSFICILFCNTKWFGDSLGYPRFVEIWNSYDEAVENIRNQTKSLTSTETQRLRFSPNPSSANLMDSRYSRWTTVCARALTSRGLDSMDIGQPIVLNSLLKLTK